MGQVTSFEVVVSVTVSLWQASQRREMVDGNRPESEQRCSNSTYDCHPKASGTAVVVQLEVS
jgi:hypothetical protein